MWIPLMFPAPKTFNKVNIATDPGAVDQINVKHEGPVQHVFIIMCHTQAFYVKPLEMDTIL